MHAKRRDYRTYVLTRLAHVYFRFSRGMTMGVRAACFNGMGHIFLVKHSYVPGWHMPGGGLEHDETALQALEKELREEGNLVLARPPVLFQVYLNRQASKRDHVLFYRCDGVEQTTPKVRDREIIESGFFALDALPDDTTPATRRRLAEMIGHAPRSDVW